MQLNIIDKVTLKNTLHEVFPEAKPGHKTFLYSEIRGRWRALCKKSSTNSTRLLPRDIAIPFVKKMAAISIAELNSQYITTTFAPTVNNLDHEIDNLEDSEINEPESESESDDE